MRDALGFLTCTALLSILGAELISAWILPAPRQRNGMCDHPEAARYCAQLRGRPGAP